VIPMIIERSKQLMRERGVADAEGESAADVLVPIMFNFPNAGRLLGLLFIPFAAWLTGNALELVGLDVELSLELADAIGVRAEFIPVSFGDVAGALDGGVIDVMPGVWYRPFWFDSLRLSDPYLTATVGVVVRDDRRHDFATVERIRDQTGLRIGVPLDTRQLAFAIDHSFGRAAVELVTVNGGAASFFDGSTTGLDGFVMPAESGAAWTLIHPDYTVVVPQPNPVELPTAFGVARDAGELLDLVDEWVVYATSEGITDRAYEYWILGRGAEERRRRWSILDDGLGWGRPPDGAGD